MHKKLVSLSNPNITHQTSPALNAPVLQVKNNAGGYVFELTPEKQLERFLILGSIGGTYYQNERQLTHQNLDVINKLIKERGEYVVNKLVEISTAGRARNNDYALLVLANCFAFGNAKTKALAKEALPKIARIGTHLMHFVEYAENARGWGSSLKKAVARWYTDQPAEKLAYQVLKYQQRDGWSQRDIIRLSHPKAKDEETQAVLNYVTKFKKTGEVQTCIPPIVVAYEQAKTADTKTLLKLITDHGLSMEMIPTEKRNDRQVWEALLPTMKATALIRNLNKLTAVGAISNFSDVTKFVTEKLTDVKFIKNGKIHPLQAYVARKTYAAGQGERGSLVWSPNRKVIEALEEMFYLSFKAVEPSGKNRMLAIDVSSSMRSYMCFGASTLNCSEGAAIMAMVTARVEPWSQIYGFSTRFIDLGINKTDNFDTVFKKVSLPYGATDCAQPMVTATAQKWNVDQFDVYTDNETYYGRIHPFQALKAYRKAMDKPEAKLAVVAMTASRFSIADPTDSNMLDVVGFDSATPAVLADFAAGKV